MAIMHDSRTFSWAPTSLTNLMAGEIYAAELVFLQQLLKDNKVPAAAHRVCLFAWAPWFLGHGVLQLACCWNLLGNGAQGRAAAGA